MLTYALLILIALVGLRIACSTDQWWVSRMVCAAGVGLLLISIGLILIQVRREVP